jgi:hypothetical protein
MTVRMGKGRSRSILSHCLHCARHDSDMAALWPLEALEISVSPPMFWPKDHDATRKLARHLLPLLSLLLWHSPLGFRGYHHRGDTSPLCTL